MFIEFLVGAVNTNQKPESQMGSVFLHNTLTFKSVSVVCLSIPPIPPLEHLQMESYACDCCGIGTLEIKCPYCSQNSTPETATENDNLKCLEHSYAEVVKLKVDNAYFYQVQAQLHICNLEFGDFVVWTPKGIHIERIYPHHFLNQQ